MQKIIQFFREATAELSRVVWPTKKQTRHYTILVVIISISTAIFLGVLDYFFGSGISRFLSGGTPAVSDINIENFIEESIEVNAEGPDGTPIELDSGLITIDDAETDTDTDTDDVESAEDETIEDAVDTTDATEQGN